MKQKSSKYLTLMRVLFLGVLLAGAILYFFNRDKISLETIVAIVPDSLPAAILVFIVLYAVKSVTIVFPIVVLQMSAGFLYSPLVGILIGIIGALTESTISFLIGRLGGENRIGSLLHKYPKIQDAAEPYMKQHLFLSFFLRILGFLPLDVVSMLLGSMKVPYRKYIVGTLLGMLPGIIITTTLGGSITDPSSPAFIVSIIAQVLLAVASLFLYQYIAKKKRQSKN